MAFKLHSLIKETSTTTGTGDLNLNGAEDGYRPFAEEYQDGDTMFVVVKMGENHEWFLGTYHQTANSISRTTMYRSTNANAAVSWPSGAKTIAVGDIAPTDLDATGRSLYRSAIGAGAGGGDMTASNYLSELAGNKALARSNIGVIIGTDVQAYSAKLLAIAGLSIADSAFIVGNGTTFVSESGATLRTSIGVGTTDSPQFTGVILGNADTTLTRSAAGVVAVGGTTLLRASQNLADVTAATAFANIKQAASETATGVVELATNAEVATGTDTTRAVTPAGITSLGHLKAAGQNQGPITGGATVTSLSLGTVTTGTLTLDVGDCGLQHYINGGAHTFAPGTNTGACMVDITNNASAGAITTSGWTKVVGSFTTTNTHKFRCHCSVGNAGSLLIIQAMQ